MKPIAELIVVGMGMMAWFVLTSGVALNLTVPTVRILQAFH